MHQYVFLWNDFRWCSFPKFRLLHWSLTFGWCFAWTKVRCIVHWHLDVVCLLTCRSWQDASSLWKQRSGCTPTTLVFLLGSPAVCQKKQVTWNWSFVVFHSTKRQGFQPYGVSSCHGAIMVFSKVELLLREIPAKAEDAKAFRCFSNCAKARNGKRLGSSNFPTVGLYRCTSPRGAKVQVWIWMLLCSKVCCCSSDTRVFG